MRVFGYARVSSLGQSLDLQTESIQNYVTVRNFELIELFKEKASGKNIDRVEFQRMMKSLELNPLSIDAIVVTKLDRIGRSLLNLIQIANSLQEKDIGIVSISDSIDTTSKEGRLFFHLMGALAEFERELILERTQEGIARARLLGTKSGRPVGYPKKLVPLKELDRLLSDGVPKSEIARRYKVHRNTIYNRIKELYSSRENY